MYDLLHKELPYHDGTFSNWSKDPSRSTPYHYDDGVTIWVSPDDLTPDDMFLSPDSPPPDDDEEGGD